MKGQGKQNNQRLKCYLVYKYLMENSDENHCVSAEEIAAHLIENMGIMTTFCDMHNRNLFTLYNIPYCKVRKYMIHYRHKEGNLLKTSKTEWLQIPSKNI